MEKKINAEQSAGDCKQPPTETGSTPQLGKKFKTASQLVKAYNELQSEFTRKSQMLKQLQREMQKLVYANPAEELKTFGNNEIAAVQVSGAGKSCAGAKSDIPVSFKTLGEDGKQDVQMEQTGTTQSEQFLDSQAETQGVCKMNQVGQEKDADFSAVETAVKAEQTTAALIDNPKTAEVLCCFDESTDTLASQPEISPDIVKAYILNNPEIAFKLMQSSLDSVETVALPLTIKGNAGAISLTPPLKPKTIREASILAEHFLKKN